MTAVFLIVSLIFYSIFIFFIDNFQIIFLLIILQIIINMLSKIKLRKILHQLKKSIFLVVFITLVNILTINLESGILIGIRLLLITNITYVIGSSISSYDLAVGFGYLLSPLKLFKINVSDIVLQILMSLTFIPILMNEAKEIKKSLQSKGFKFNFKNLFTKPHIFLMTFFNSLYYRINDIEKTMISKGFES